MNLYGLQHSLGILSGEMLTGIF